MRSGSARGAWRVARQSLSCSAPRCRRTRCTPPARHLGPIVEAPSDERIVVKGPGHVGRRCGARALCAMSHLTRTRREPDYERDGEYAGVDRDARPGEPVPARPPVRTGWSNGAVPPRHGDTGRVLLVRATHGRGRGRPCQGLDLPLPRRPATNGECVRNAGTLAPRARADSGATRPIAALLRRAA